MPSQFDIFASPLTGTHLIEASAGTGKTHAIEGLFLRLLVEKGLSVREILVVTFTNAATAELRERIRRRLVELSYQLRGMGSEDRLAAMAADAARDKEEAALRIIAAIQGFDEAAIYTIHGFCARVLRDSAFETKTLFDTELVTDQEDLLNEASEDFWRQNISKASGIFLEYVLGSLGLHDLVSLYHFCSKLPLRRIIPESSDNKGNELEKRYREAHALAAATWIRERERVTEILMTDKALNRRSYPPEKIPKWTEAIDRYLKQNARWSTLPEKADRFGADGIMGAVKKNHQAPANEFFRVWDAFLATRAILEDDLRQRTIRLKRRFLDYMRTELDRKKKARNLAHFDDLLTRLHDAVCSPEGTLPARMIASRYKAVLIDEFQDTDPIQYEIFKCLFRGAEGSLFLIGDPKQAIYSFRGADVFTYMAAGREVPSRYTLLENWRSQPRLVDAINALFTAGRAPFVFQEITFEPAIAAKTKIHRELRLEGGPQEPFLFWYLERSPGEGETTSKQVIRKRICTAVCCEIARLVKLGRSRKAFLGEKPLEEADIAVLVRKNRDAEMIKEGLSRLHVPAVLHHVGSVFDTKEALELQRVLAAVERPSRQELLRAALATDFMGLTARQLETGTPEFWDGWTSSFKSYAEQWVSSGFMSMFRRLISEQGVLARLAAYQEGERRITNVIHLAELLNKACIEQGKAMAELIRWLAEKRGSEITEREEYQLRLESDERAVQILTIHKSKGLQYPIVFCPFLWDIHSPKSAPPLVFHDEMGNLVLDLGSKSLEANAEVSRRETLAEEMRLFYVALTRACTRCYLVWRGLDAGPLLSHLLCEGTGQSTGDLSTLLVPVLKRARGSIRFEALPQVAVPPLDRFGEKASLECRRFTGKIHEGPLITSFTALKEGYEDDDARDMDQQESAYEGSALDGLPTGSSFGIFIHKLFEEADFARDAMEGRRDLIRRLLKDHGLEASLQDGLLAMMERVLSFPLPASEGTFTLNQIEASERIKEMEFLFPVKAFSGRSLLRVLEEFQQHGLTPRIGSSKLFPDDLLNTVEGLELTPLGGFMRGFIDLVFRFGNRFYLIDWKSNKLGEEPSSYCQEALEGVMSRNLYHLQYLIYVTALHKFLASRLNDYDYERHFGEVFYLFIRGMDKSGCGIYRARPPLELVERLCTLMNP